MLQSVHRLSKVERVGTRRYVHVVGVPVFIHFVFMTVGRKRLAESGASKMPKAQRGRKQNRSFQRHQYIDWQVNNLMENTPPKKMWQKKKQNYRVCGNGESKAIVPLGMLRPFYSVEGLAEWVFNVAKNRPFKLSLDLCEESEEVRDALLRQFHRWPEVKVASAAKQFQTLSLEAEQKCSEQVQLYLQELRGRLLGGSNALFWLGVLQPLTHSAPVPRPEVREVLMALLEEIKGIDGVYELLTEKHERAFALLTLPLKLEPLFQGVSALAQCGHDAAANEAMDLLIMFAEELTGYPGRKKGTFPVGLSVVSSVGSLVPLEVSGLSQFSEDFRERLAAPLSKMAGDWLVAVDEVLGVVEKSLMSRWLACESAPFEEELTKVVQTDLQRAFERLSHALATDQLYAMRKVGGERMNVSEDCLDIAIFRERGLLHVQFCREGLWM